MADIELVIKISEKAYNALTHTEFDANLVVDEMRKSIAHGTPLEQEPKTDTLDKIRAEIDAQREKLKIMADDDWYAGKIRGYDCAIEIINKYKASPTGAESEVGE